MGRGDVKLKFGLFYAIVTFIVIAEAVAVGWSGGAIFPAVAFCFTAIFVEVYNANSRWNILIVTVAVIFILWQIPQVISGTGG